MGQMVMGVDRLLGDDVLVDAGQLDSIWDVADDALRSGYGL